MSSFVKLYILATVTYIYRLSVSIRRVITKLLNFII